MPHTQCLGFLLGYTKFVLYDIFMFGVRDFGKCRGGVNCLRFLMIYTSIHFHIYIYIYIYEMNNNYVFVFYMVPTSVSFPTDPLDVILLIWFCKSATILFNN